MAKLSKKKQEELDFNISFTCLGGDLERVKELHQKGANVNQAIWGASRFGHLDIVKYLVEHGADVNESLPLKSVCSKGYTEIAKYLIENGADVNGNDEHNDNYISLASREGHYEIVKLLAENGGDVNAEDRHGNKAIYYASVDSNLEMVKFLHQKGADLDISIEWAKKWANPSFKEELINYKTSMNEQKILSNDLKEVQSEQQKTKTMRI